jgi:hypothetical protein
MKDMKKELDDKDYVLNKGLENHEERISELEK